MSLIMLFHLVFVADMKYWFDVVGLIYSWLIWALNTCGNFREKHTYSNNYLLLCDYFWSAIVPPHALVAK